MSPYSKIDSILIEDVEFNKYYINILFIIIIIITVSVVSTYLSIVDSFIEIKFYKNDVSEHALCNLYGVYYPSFNEGENKLSYKYYINSGVKSEIREKFKNFQNDYCIILNYDKKDISEELIRNGNAIVSDTCLQNVYCKNLSEIQKKAISQKKGIWKKNIFLYYKLKIKNLLRNILLLTTFFLSLILFIKIISIFNAINWIRKFGNKYKNEYRKISIQSNGGDNRIKFNEYCCLVEKCNGDWFPFGVKDFKLKLAYTKFYKNGKLKYKILSYFIFLFQNYIYRLQRLSIICCFFVVLSSIAFSEFMFNESLFAKLFIYFQGILLLIANSIITIEAAYCYAIFNDYATTFHMISRNMDFFSNGNKRLLELKLISGKIINAIACSSVSVYSSFIMFDGFKGDSLVSGLAWFKCFNILHQIYLLLQFVYFSTTTFVTVGFGDIVPANWSGQIVTFLIEVQSFCIVIIVIASMFSSKDE